MKRAPISWTLGIVVMVWFAGCGSRIDREAQIALRARLAPATGAVQSWSFTAKVAGPQEISLEVPWPVQDREAADLIQRADLDCSWFVLEGGKELAQGTGHGGPRDVADSPAIRALPFGTFRAQAGATYTLRVNPGQGFEPLLRLRPAVVVEGKPST